MKNYLRAYINHVQDNWMDHLPMAIFAANNHVNISTRVTLFFAHNGFYPQTGIKLLQPTKAIQKAKLFAADKIVAN